MSVPKEIFLIGLVFGMCLSANFAAQTWGRCSGFTLEPRNPCAVVLAAINCTASMVLLYLTYAVVSSGGGGGF